MISFLRKRPWLWIVLVFLILIASWIFLIQLAREHAPQPITPDTPPIHESP